MSEGLEKRKDEIVQFLDAAAALEEAKKEYEAAIRALEVSDPVDREFHIKYHSHGYRGSTVKLHTLSEIREEVELRSQRSTRRGVTLSVKVGEKFERFFSGTFEDWDSFKGRLYFILCRMVRSNDWVLSPFFRG